jgi:hypothetical protein
MFEEVKGRIDSLELEVERKRALKCNGVASGVNRDAGERQKRWAHFLLTFSKPNMKFKATAMDDTSSDGALLWCAPFQGNIAERWGLRFRTNQGVKLRGRHACMLNLDTMVKAGRCTAADGGGVRLKGYCQGLSFGVLAWYVRRGQRKPLKMATTRKREGERCLERPLRRERPSSPS